MHKDYVLDYSSALKDVIMEAEQEAGVLTYRYVYGLEKAHVVIYGLYAYAWKNTPWSEKWKLYH